MNSLYNVKPANTLAPLTTRDIKYLDIAYRLAASAPHRFKVAALIANGSRILALSTNIIKTHPTTQEYYPDRVTTIHAEARAIALARGNGDTIYIARFTSYGMGISRPCVMCRDLIELAGLRRICYYDGVRIIKERI